jgi:hypothetical protein
MNKIKEINAEEFYSIVTNKKLHSKCILFCIHAPNINQHASKNPNLAYTFNCKFSEKSY